MKMNTEKVLNPYSLPATFRAYVYDAIVLTWEFKHVNSIFPTFNNKTLCSDCGLDVLMLDTLNEVQLRDQDILSTDEFLIFHKRGSGYAGLFKRLRDTFAHGHYGLNEQGWITIRHRYKGPKEKAAKTRAFGHLRIGTIKKLVAFLDTSALV
jgi:hypothetical protein